MSHIKMLCKYTVCGMAYLGTRKYYISEINLACVAELAMPVLLACEFYHTIPQLNTGKASLSF